MIVGYHSHTSLSHVMLGIRFEVAFRHHPEELLIPSHLPKQRPVVNLPRCAPGGWLPHFLTSNQQIVIVGKIIRRYRMCYIPPGFWPRLTARLLIFPKRALQVFNQHQVVTITFHPLHYLYGFHYRAVSTMIQSHNVGVMEYTVSGMIRLTS